MPKVMMTLKQEGPPPTLEDIQQRFGLTDDQVDKEFGVVEVDPEAHIYTFLCDQDAAARVNQEYGEGEVEGPFSNPRIEPFGPPSS